MIYTGTVNFSNCPDAALELISSLNGCKDQGSSVWGFETGSGDVLLFNTATLSYGGTPEALSLTYTADGAVIDGQQTLSNTEWFTFTTTTATIDIAKFFCLSGGGGEEEEVIFKNVKIVCPDDVFGYTCDGARAFEGLPAVQPDGHVYRVKLDCEAPTYTALPPVCKVYDNGIDPAITLACNESVNNADPFDRFKIYFREDDGEVFTVDDESFLSDCVAGSREFVAECYRGLIDIAGAMSIDDELAITYTYDTTAGAVGSGNEILVSAAIINNATGVEVERVNGPADPVWSIIDIADPSVAISCDNWKDPNTPVVWVECFDTEPQCSETPVSSVIPGIANYGGANSANVTINGNEIVNISAGWNGGAYFDPIIQGDGSITGEMTVQDGNGRFMIGLLPQSQLATFQGNGAWAPGTHKLYIFPVNSPRVYQGNSFLGSFGTPCAIGDEYKIAIEGGAVNYYQNGNVIYTSTVPPNAEDYYGYVSMSGAPVTVSNITIEQ